MTLYIMQNGRVIVPYDTCLSLAVLGNTFLMFVWLGTVMIMITWHHCYAIFMKMNTRAYIQINYYYIICNKNE